MPPVSIVVPLGIGAFLAALVLTMLARMYAIRRQLLDVPGERRSHHVATPRGGGIAIVAVVLPVMLWLGLAGDVSPLLLLGACGLALVAAIGLIDDHRPLSPWARLAVHVLAAALLAAGLALSGGPVWWCAVVFVLALGLVNAWNFMDGINGIAASQAILVALAFASAQLPFSGSIVIVAGVVAAACAGFLPWNFPKARIFLGDVGSGSLGYVVACLFALVLNPVTADLAVMILPLSAVLIDTTLTMLSRIIAGERFWLPHVKHLYQLYLQAGHSHAAVSCGYMAWTLSAIVVAVVIAGAPQAAIIGTFATWYLIGAAIWFFSRARLLRRASVVGTRLHD